MHPCQTCGACCTIYSVQFDPSELTKDPYNVPAKLTFKMSKDVLAMKSRVPGSTRCVALDGNLGRYVSCGIYNNRPSPCRKFMASYENGIQNPRCDDSRRKRGMKPLTPEDFSQPPQASL